MEQQQQQQQKQEYSSSSSQFEQRRSSASFDYKSAAVGTAAAAGTTAVMAAGGAGMAALGRRGSREVIARQVSDTNLAKLGQEVSTNAIKTPAEAKAFIREFAQRYPHLNKHAGRRAGSVRALC